MGLSTLKNLDPLGGALNKTAGKAAAGVTGVSEFKRIGQHMDAIQKDPVKQGKADWARTTGKVPEEPVAVRQLQRPMSTWYRG